MGGDNLIAVSDTIFNKILANEAIQRDHTQSITSQKIYGFVVDNWTETRGIAKNLINTIQPEYKKPYQFTASSLEWLYIKQGNRSMLLFSVLVGIVFFTFASSFLYFRLYTDLDQEKKQYKMIWKMGLTKKELKKVMTQELLVMFFLPIFVAIFHSIVAFFAMSKLLNYSTFTGSIIVLGCFCFIQIVYFLIIRWRYLQQLYRIFI
ncbi:hypothetical protein COD67_08100 [Bacillus cereus]|nr:hypothetical protein COI89_21995 [Bacillus cereus]PGU67968.1 hypothetical protein COD67_08100 [Bacillus cereus]